MLCALAWASVTFITEPASASGQPRLFLPVGWALLFIFAVCRVCLRPVAKKGILCRPQRDDRVTGLWMVNQSVKPIF